MANRDLREILDNNPFQRDTPTEYEEFLNAALELAYGTLAAQATAIESLSQRISEHEKMHTAANVAAMRMPDTEKDVKPN